MSWVTKILLVILGGMVVSCAGIEDDFYVEEVIDREIDRDAVTPIQIKGGHFAPSVRRNVGCGGGAEGFEVDYEFHAFLSATGSNHTTWHDIGEVVWVDSHTLTATIDRDLSSKLYAAVREPVYDLQVAAPSGEFRILLRAVEFVLPDANPVSTDTDTTDTETEGTETEDTETEDTETEDTETEDTETEDTETEDTETEDTDTGDCVSGTIRCADSTNSQTCGADNMWGPASPCTFICDVGGAETCAGECTPATVRCADGARNQVCGANYMWGPASPCTFICDVGGSEDCTGECMPGSVECADGTNERTCGLDYMWEAPAPCPYICDVGGNETCAGECNPNDVRCVDGTRNQTCGANYLWGPTSLCTYICDVGGTEDCAGECTPGVTECADGFSLHTCGLDYMWEAPTACPYVCDMGFSEVCGGECNPGDVRCLDVLNTQTCGNDYFWESPAPCPYFCDEAGAVTGTEQCAGECSPGTTQCADGFNNQDCGSDYFWGAAQPCAYMCDEAGTGDCGGECAPAVTACADGFNIHTCGNDYLWEAATPCTWFCDAGGTETCDGECSPGTNRCEDATTIQTCGADYFWNLGVSCPGTCTLGVCDPIPGKYFYAEYAPPGTFSADGRFDEPEWDVSDPIDRVIYGPDFTANWDSYWNEGRLEIAVQVSDISLHNDSADPWEDDSVEIYVDGGNEKGTTYDSNDNRYIHTYGTSTLWVDTGLGLNVDHFSTDWSGYYTFEISIPFPDLGVSPVSGDTIGFDIRINDDDDGNDAESARMWSGNEDAAFNPSVFGNILLIDRSAYDAEPVSNTCGSVWMRNAPDDLDEDILISWDNYTDTLDGDYDPDCAVGDRDVFFWVFTPAGSSIDITYKAGFDNIIIRAADVPVACPDVDCKAVTGIPNHAINLSGGAFDAWSWVIISSIGATNDDITIIDFTRN